MVRWWVGEWWSGGVVRWRGVGWFIIITLAPVCSTQSCNTSGLAWSPVTVRIPSSFPSARDLFTHLSLRSANQISVGARRDGMV